MARKKKIQLARRTKIESGVIFDEYEKLPIEEFHKRRHAAHQYYYQEWTGKALVDQVFVWMKANGWSKRDIDCASKARGINAISENIGAWCKVLADGCPAYYEKHIEYMQTLPGITMRQGSIVDSIEKSIKNAIASVNAENVVVEKPVKAVTVNIQQRIKSAAFEVCKEIDEWLDTFIDNPKKFDPNGIDVLKLLQEKDMTGMHALHIAEAYRKEFIQTNEILLTRNIQKNPNYVLRDEDEQMLEAYEHLTTAQLNKYKEALKAVIEACNLVREKKKVQRKPRKKKPVDVQKLANKIKYMKSHDQYKIVSVDPLEIIGAQEVWVFNTKYRMLGHYFANDKQSLAIKGTTILNYDESKSVERKLRKPEEQLAEFKACGKVALRKFMESIRAKDSTLRGRLNADVVILKVIK